MIREKKRLLGRRKRDDSTGLSAIEKGPVCETGQPLGRKWRLECLFFSTERVGRGCHHQKTGRNVWDIDGAGGQWVNH